MNSNNSVAVLFTGLLIGLLGGFLLGALVGRSVFQLANVLIQTASRQTRSDKEKMKFELLLQ
ncbi:MAG: hypothetical protein M9953_00265 [Thermomicrobiales bacterium]|nr:hypothetical protein [Thermomicrobiales bacterium]MCO5223758.1 hypothetical protein [Thermomicrobiales bacterium]